MTRTFPKLIALMFALGVMAGCSSTGETQEEGAYGSDVSAVDQEGGSEVYGGDGSSGVSSSDMTAEERAQESAQAEAAAMRKITTFYFDFDTSEIKSESRDVLVAHAKFLSENPNRSIRLEGHGDERGTKEYNLALGERRAKAVERFLIVNGASRDQIETISYGEEKPAVMGQGESVWAQNRRVELIYQ
ncbi:MAG: peptidoglycan-associated lipoprotein [Alteromonadaceae bacterium]|uniref:peptidoglycan-associated lipoprotein Pal n=1 Tax=unclassified Marinobacter TaxID=83889 RepID=UPI000C4732C2|nr:peptidoglycan-associated lipoprotein Pal [Marinobacter sp. BGYM27]MAA65541.1 peptidoglycan-associated lipoprotein [Alteromonadaceae bacterium]MBH86123.1 peptidoglycan-associated lipoprotein [Alteromonadaceae bacterium]MDG5498908.1 peptidoglycan-associated lipoprotein Pal [Marinobacter sp. BGYM27]|tara:strand:- start:1108 stop:1674 length:567 start_codon:yes stop_codon:yes gene_type:complete